MNQTTKQTIDLGVPGLQQIAVQPRGELVFTGLPFDDVAVDIIDTDVVLTNPDNGDRLILMGLAIYLFDDEEVPSMSFDGQVVPPNELLSKVGEIQNLTMQEFVAVTSLLEDSFKTSEEENEDEESENTEQYDTSSDVLVAILQAIEAMNEAQQAASPEVKVAEDEGKYDRKAVDEEGDTFLENSKKASSDASSSASSSSEAPEVPEAEILFDLSLLQLARSEQTDTLDGVETRQILGGGGSEESAFNPANEAQFSTEVLNYGTSSDDLTIHTDNPAYFDAGTMTRVIELAPTFPAGFLMTEVRLSGFPDGFVIEGAQKVGNAWVIEQPLTNERGALSLNLIYEVPSDETFAVDFAVTAEFQEGTLDAEGLPLATPSEPTLTSEDSRLFEVRDVFGASELNYTNTAGEEVWVLANNPNPNRVFSGFGNDTITGAVGTDFIQGGGGDDVIDGGAGNDVLDGEAGDDRLLHGAGLDQYIGGSGVDTLDYQAVDVDVHADLSRQVDNFASVTVDPEGPGAGTDQVREVENLITGRGNDDLTGDDADNHLQSGDGDDRLVGKGGHDVLDGGEGIDTADYADELGPIVVDLSLESGHVTVDESSIDTLVDVERVIGTDFDDVMRGAEADDTFLAGEGNDRLAGGDGSNTLDGGAGDRDVADFSALDQGVQVDLGGATDAEGFVRAVHGDEADRLAGIEDLEGSDHDDTLIGDAQDQFISGNAGDDRIDGAAGDDQLDGGAGRDAVSGGAGDDIFLHSDGGDRLDGGDDQDTLDFSLTEQITRVDAVLDGANDSRVQVEGGDDLTVSNIENLTGTTGDDRLQGDANDNILRGGDGDDALIGAAGDDQLIGGEGLDSADYSVATVGVNIDLSAGEVSNDGFGGRDAIDGIENLTGSDHDDVLAGDAQDNVLRGGTGDDTLIGRAGNDQLVGGEGQDTASYEFSRAAVVVDLDADAPTQDGEGGLDRFDSIESATGSLFNDELYGDAQSNTLSGLDGNDRLDGRGGDDLLLGGAGDDLLLAGEGSDQFDGGSGSDVLDYSALASAERIELTLDGAQYAEVMVDGSDNDQVRNVETIIATSGDDVIGGDDRANTLHGEAGDDVIRGGEGADQLFGGDGEDELRFDDLTADGITLSLNTQTASYAIDGSTDRFSGFERYAGTHQDDRVVTSSGEDHVDGLGGDDHFLSSAGSDELIGGDGKDVVDYSEQAGIDHIEVTLDEGRTITVNVVGGDDDSLTTVEGIIGSAGDDILIGDSLDNELAGAAGNDLLDGRAGDDTLLGDAGDDRFLGGEGDDSHVGGSGTDVIDYSAAQGGISVDLSQNAAINDGFGGQDEISGVENIIGTDDRDVITGDARANELVSGAGDDVVRGGGGSDRLDGGVGDADEVHFDDLVNFGVTLDLAAGTAFYPGDVSTDVLIGFELYYTTAQDDSIRGSDAADTVFSGGGDDAFVASAGADVLDGGAGSDSIDYSALIDATHVQVTLDGTQAVSVDVGGVALQTISRIENVTGSAGDDVIGGDTAANTLIGGDGDDRIFGGAGSDRLEGGAGSDELRFDELGSVGITLTLGAGLGTAIHAADNSIDTFTGFEQYVTTRQDDLVFTSAEIDSVFTLAGDDRIQASAGSDRIDGGLGTDEIDYSSLSGTTGIAVSLAGATAVQVIVQAGDDDTISNIENITGTSGGDTLTGDEQGNRLTGLGGADDLAGGAGDDELIGGDGNDQLRGGEGDDVLSGGLGQDSASYSDASGGVSVDLSTGQTANDGFGGTDQLSSIENLEGSDHADRLVGNGSGNRILGGAGDDVVYGGLGSDELLGGSHVLGDTLRFDDLLGGSLQLDLAAGTATFSGDQSVDTFSGFERYIGTEQADTLDGSVLADVVNLLGGDDHFNASTGSDTLDGGEGADTLDYSGLVGTTGISANLNGSTAITVTVSGGDNDTISNIEHLTGSTGDDTLGGDDVVNRLQGLAGDDRFLASGGADHMHGGDGSDTLDYSALAAASAVSVTLDGSNVTTVAVTGSDDDTISGIENVVGTSGSDTLIGDDQDNRLEGRAGTDTLDGGAGADTLLGGDGADLLIASEGADVSDGGAGVDTADFSGLAAGQSIDVTLAGGSDATVTIAGGDDQTIRNVENVIGTDESDSITGDTAQNTIQAGAGDDVLGASANTDTLDGAAGSDTVDYSTLTGVQRISVALDGENTSTVNVSGGSNDTIVRIENVIGTGGDDLLAGDGQDNHLQGLGGDDTLSGGAGNDVLDGGSGAFTDTVSYADAGQGVTVDLSAGVASEDGFGGVDTLIDIEQLEGSNFDDDLSSGSGTERIEAADGDDYLTLGLGAMSVDGGSGIDTADYSALAATNAISVELDGQNSVTLSVTDSADQTLTAIENVIGSQGDDVLTGDDNANTLDGGLGNDTLQGLGGDDTLIGGDGVDRADYSQAGGAVSVDLSANEASDDGDGGVDTLSGIENLSGSNFDDVLIGDDSDNTLQGRSGADTLSGGAGLDVIDGGSGRDVADYSRASGNVAVDLSANTASDDGEGDSDSLLRIEDVIGSAQDDQLYGDANANALTGGVGDDVLRGAGGFDTLDGGDGSDTADYSMAGNQVVVNLASQSASNDGDGSFDTLSSIENVQGSDHDDQLTGSADSNRLSGGAGDDLLIGAAGNDTLDGGVGGSDTVDYSAAANAIDVNLAAGQALSDGYLATDTLIDIENVIGSDQDDVIAGNASANEIAAGDGDDALTASAGSDRIDGGDGSDLLDYSALAGIGGVSATLNGASATIVTASGGDNDTISNIEHLTGSTGDDTLGGDVSVNRLQGLAGDDRFLASAGADEMHGGDGSDTLDYSALAAASAVSVTLDGSNVTTVAVTGIDDDTISGIENVVGTSGSDTLIGDDQDNRLEGRAGSDTLDGGAGADTLLGGDGSDLLIASEGADVSDGGAGVDTADFSGLAAGQSIDVTLAGGSDATVAIAGGDDQTIRNVENVIGTDEADTITGDTAQNTIQAGAGDDVLGASANADTLDGGSGTDTIDYSSLAGAARINVTLNGAIQSTVQVTGGSDDRIANIENVIGTAGNDTLTGDGADNHLQGLAGNDTLIGNAGNDVLDGGAGTSDTVDYSGATNGIDVDLASGLALSDGHLGSDTLIDIENVVGSDQDDVIGGNASANVIDAGIGDDALTASDGSDRIDGGDGSDSLDYSGLTGIGGISASLNGATAITVTVSGGDNDTISNIEHLTGSIGDDTLGGDISINRLHGLAGDDRFIASGGADEMHGGDGSDTLDYSALAAASAVSVTLDGSNVTTVAVTGSDDDTISGIENVVGTSGSDTLIGDDQDNRLEGRAGSDTLDGGAGADTLLGGDGADLLIASEGADVSDGGAGVDTADFSGLAAGQSIDVTLAGGSDATVTIAGGDDQTMRRVENVIGTDEADSITGDTAQNTIQAGAGDDVLGASANTDTLDGGSGTDTIDYSSLAGAARINVTLNGAIQSTVQVTGGSDDRIANIENVIGTAGNDTLIGDGQDNQLEGLAGNDTLIGNGGNDVLDGGAGSSDTVDYSAAGSGIDVDLSTGIVLSDGFGTTDTLIDIENVIGSNQDDAIAGNASGNDIDAGDGDDTLTASAGGDRIDGGDGSDSLDYSGLTGIGGISASLNGATAITVTVSGGDNDTISNIEHLTGSIGDDTLGGDISINRLHGLAGDDRFIASAGADEMHGGDGSDTLDYSALAAASAVSVTLDGSNVTTVAVTGSDDDTISGIENVVGTSGSDTLIGDDQDNRLEGRAGSDTLDGGAGADTLLGGDGADLLIASEGADISDGGAGVDTADFSGLAAGQSIDVTLAGSSDATVTIAGGDDQTIRNVENVIGTDEADTITGDTAQNTIQAGAGDDVLGASANSDTLDGGAGSDTVDYSTLAGLSRISVTLDGAIQTTVQVTGAADDRIVNIENVVGTTGNDTLIGDGEDNRLEGLAGNDTLVGGAGNDVLDGGSGAFTDTVSYADAGQGVTVDLSTGVASEDGFGGVDTLIDIEQLEGSDFDDDLSSGSGTERIEAADGDDYLTLGLGAMSVDGGSGIDTADYSALAAPNAISVELDGQNSVTLSVTGSADQTLTAIENVIGSQGDDVLTGDNNVNVLDGGLGNDTLQGLGGDDTLIGGDGVDRADYSQAGGAVSVDLSANEASDDGDGGVDTLSGIENLSGSNFDDVLIGDDSDNALLGNAGADTLSGGAGLDVIDGGSGRDTADYSAVTGAVAVDLSANTASDDGEGDSDTLLRIEDVIGSAQDDQLYGDANANALTGGVGDDVLRGAGGFDTLDGGDGSDTADYSTAGNQVVVNLASQSASNDGDGSFDTLSSIENVQGSDHDDQLTGSADSNRLSGGAGDDLLIGAGGNDTLDGGVGGSDTVDYSAAANAIDVDLAAGQALSDGYLATDTLIDIENVIGSDQDDVIAGNASGNIIAAGDGDDTLTASAGSDRIDGGDGSDLLDYSALAGIGGVSATLNGASATIVTVSGGDNDTISNIEHLTGSTGDDTLGGDVFVNRLQGLAGDDRFLASGGADEMHGGDGLDTVDYSTLAAASAISIALQGTNASTVSVTGSDDDTISGIENVVGTSGSDTLIGDDQDNRLEGRAGSDTLDGGAGADTLLGGDGSDLLIASEGADVSDGGAGVDTADFSGLSSGQSIDVTLAGGSDATVTIAGGDDQTIRRVENVIGTDEADSITGDTAQNTIQAGAGDDVLGASANTDTLDGGDGSDTIDYSTLSGVQRINVTLDGENPSTVNVSGGANDTIVRIENVIGTGGDDVLAGDGQDNHLQGLGGDDMLSGGAGNDVLDGGSGAFTDTVSYADAGKGVIVDLSTGIASQDGFDSMDTLIDIEQLEGSDFDDDLTSSSGTERIEAADGDDRIALGLGAITVDGGDGSDTADYSALAATNAVSVELDGLNNVTVSINGAADQTLTAVENLVGSQGDDVLTGDANANTLDGGLGDDVLQGLGGDDTLIGGDGVDRADYSRGQWCCLGGPVCQPGQ